MVYQTFGGFYIYIVAPHCLRVAFCIAIAIAIGVGVRFNRLRGAAAAVVNKWRSQRVAFRGGGGNSWRSSANDLTRG